MQELRKIDNITNPFNNAPVYYTDETPSTMKLAESFSSSSAPPNGTVISAGIQTAGRGRIPGRVWEASRDKNLLFTIILSKSDIGNIPLPIVAGLGISRYLENYHQLESKIKWPNDIFVQSRKISGIIIDSRKGLFNIGIGININQTKFTDSISGSATSLSILKNRSFDLFIELELILAELKAVLSSGKWQKDVTSRLYNIGKEVSIITGVPGQENIISGNIQGIGSGGQLILKNNGKLLEIFSGEIKQ